MDLISVVDLDNGGQERGQDQELQAAHFTIGHAPPPPPPPTAAIREFARHVTSILLLESGAGQDRMH